jgi:hypothetical protein
MKILVSIFLLITCINCDLSAQVVLNANFEDGDRTAAGKLNYSAGLVCTDDCMTIINVPGQGNVLRAVTYRNSPCNCGNSIRCGTQQIKTGADSLVMNKYYSVKMYCVNFDSVVNDRNGILMQWKTSTDMYPAVAIWEVPSGGQTIWQLRIVADTNNNNNTALDLPSEQVIINILPIVSNTWHTWEFDVNWQDNHTGYIRCYLNGALVASYNGANCNKQYNANAKAYDPWRPEVYNFAWCPGNTGNTPWRQVCYDDIVISNVEKYNAVERLFRGLFK